MNADFLKELEFEVGRLDDKSRQQLLEYVKSLGRSGRLTVAERIARHSGVISAADAKEMRDAIEEGCEQVDKDGW